MRTNNNIGLYYLGNLIEQKHPSLTLFSNITVYTYQKIISIEPGRINGIDRNNFNSVPIIEFKLFSCGFTKSQDMWTNSSVSLKLASWSKYDIYFSNELIYRNIEYMHELQNIYSIHVKQELDVDSVVKYGC